jgi:NitT/TauT family transport system substrate-binding protein
MSFQRGTFTRRSVLKAGVAATGVLATPFVSRGQPTERLKFSLEFRIYGGNAPMFLGAENGTFRDLGLEVAIDGASGSAESVTRVASGIHDFGLADASTVVEFGARNPGVGPKLIMTVFDRFPAVVLSLKPKPIRTLQDLVGARLGTGTNDAGVKILPALLARNKIDPSSINRITVDVKLRETLLLKGDVDAVIAFDYTAVFNLIEAGLTLDDINLLYYSQFGFDFPGDSLIASPSTIANNPDLVRRVAIAVARSWVAGARDREAAINAVVNRDRLLRAATERQRLDWVYDRIIMTPSVRENGLGYFDPARMQKGLEVLSEGFQLARIPTLDDVYDGRFLPPSADRKFA